MKDGRAAGHADLYPHTPRQYRQRPRQYRNTPCSPVPQYAMLASTAVGHTQRQHRHEHQSRHILWASLTRTWDSPASDLVAAYAKSVPDTA
eukprot:1669353-Rhodomonas_salina.1